MGKFRKLLGLETEAPKKPAPKKAPCPLLYTFLSIPKVMFFLFFAFALSVEITLADSGRLLTAITFSSL